MRLLPECIGIMCVHKVKKPPQGKHSCGGFWIKYAVLMEDQAAILAAGPSE